MTLNEKGNPLAALSHKSMAPSAPPQQYDNLHGAMASVEIVTPIVDVTAPATLPAGYRFEAVFDGRKFEVVVPAGGVEKGQVFSVSVPPQGESSTVSNRIVTAGFKDNIFGCCRYGCCHPSCCVPYFCIFCAMGQVMTRLKLTWYASPGSAAEVRKTYKILAVIGSFLFLLSFFVHTNSLLILSFISLLIFAGSIYLIVIGIKTRSYLRQKYNIPANTCCPCFQPCEDCCITYYCMCCSTSQMLRHTAEYEKDEANCCTSTGLANSTLCPLPTAQQCSA